MYDLMILGGGPAGLAASVYAARKQLKTLLISEDIGGQMSMTLDIENYLGYQFIGGPELIDKFQAQVNQFPIDQKIGKKICRLKKIIGGFEVATKSGDSYKSKVVILATGKRPRKLNVLGETEFTGKGITYCAICDGPIFAKQRVAIIGGGNSALEAAFDMAKIAEHVHLISLTALTGDAILIDKLSNTKNLTIFTEHETKEIKGEDFVNGILIRDLHNGQSRLLEVAGVFVEIGLIPNSEPVSELVKLNKHGEVPVNCSCETKLSGLFAAGDVTDVPEKQIVIATGEGAKAALQAHRYLRRLPNHPTP
ncbi:MAG: FAD-dependent oxidoreductase [Dehalococcoidales bacterium]|jgi:alkyl hydroperoxide reductase subunit F|nr:FAD-dependent oxidoreductase [Dehalococcoidales bacterium]